MKLATLNHNQNSNFSKKIKKAKKQTSTKGNNFKIKNEKEKGELKMNIKKLWTIAPFFIKFISFTTLILYILNLFFKEIAFYLSNIPLYSVCHFQFWRFFTSFLITTNFFNVILGLIFWTREGSLMEPRLGTLKYMLIFIRNNFFIQIIYTIIISLISLIIRDKNFMEKKVIYKNESIYSVQNSGFWPGIIFEITLLCICNPNTKVKFFFIPHPFSEKYYPFIWFILFCLVNSTNYNNDIEVFIGLLFAIIYQNYLKNILNISDNFIDTIEKKLCCSCLLNLTGFVSVNKLKNKFEGKKLNKRMNEQILNLNKKITRKLKIIDEDTERDVKINSDNSNRNDNSMISIITPSKSLFQRPISLNKSLP